MANEYPSITDPEMRAMIGLPPLTGWVPYSQSGQSDTEGFTGWRNMETGQLTTTDPNSVVNPLYAIGMNQAQGEGATSTPFYADPARNAQYAPYWDFIEQALGDNAAANLKADPNFDLAKHFSPAKSTGYSTENVQQANAGIQSMLAANPGLELRNIPGVGTWTPWASPDDFNARQSRRPGFNDNSSGLGGIADFFGDIPGDLFRVGGELLQEPGVLALLAAGTGGALMGGAGAGAASGLTAAEEAAMLGAADVGVAGTGAAVGGGSTLTQLAATGGESFVGPATGTALEPGLQASGAIVNPVTATAPTVSGVASGTGPFVAPVFGTGAASVLSNAFDSGRTGGGSSLAPTGEASVLNRLLSAGIPAAIGAYAADRQADAYEGLARDYMNMGAPYRSRLSELYTNPSSYLTSSEVTVPVQQGTDAMARALSVNGNPTGSGTALQEIQNYATNSLYGRLGQEKDRLAGFGGLTQYNAAAPTAATNAIGANAGVYGALGKGAANFFNPPIRYSLADLARDGGTTVQFLN